MSTKIQFLKDLEAKLVKIAKTEFSSDEEAEVAAWYLAISRECEQHGVKFDSKKLKRLMPDLGKVKQELNRVLYDDLTTEKDPRYDNYYIFPEVSKWKKRCLENDPYCVSEWNKKMGSNIKLGEDARMSESFLKNILETTNDLLDMIDVNEDLDDWVDAKITKAHEALQDVYNFIRNYDKNAGLRIDKKPPKLFKPEKAVQVAKELKKSDPDWDYRVKHDPKGKGYSFIEIYDEDGKFLGTLNE